MRLTNSPIDRFVRAAEHFYRTEQEAFDTPSGGPNEELRNKRLRVWKRVMVIREAAWRASVGLGDVP
jgi:hypothetical protein